MEITNWWFAGLFFVWMFTGIISSIIIIVLTITELNDKKKTRKKHLEKLQKLCNEETDSELLYELEYLDLIDIEKVKEVERAEKDTIGFMKD